MPVCSYQKLKLAPRIREAWTDLESRLESIPVPVSISFKQ